MSRLTIRPFDQAELEAEFRQKIEAIRDWINSIDGSVSTELVANLIGRRRSWIERRLLEDGNPSKINVSLVDVLALRYVLFIFDESNQLRNDSIFSLINVSISEV